MPSHTQNAVTTTDDAATLEPMIKRPNTRRLKIRDEAAVRLFVIVPSRARHALDCECRDDFVVVERRFHRSPLRALKLRYIYQNQTTAPIDLF
jgi:hypothetical protein